MFNLPTPAYFLEWQIWHYEKRLKEEQRPKAKRFLANQLKHLKGY
jgi:hypothetical protein